MAAWGTKKEHPREAECRRFERTLQAEVADRSGARSGKQATKSPGNGRDLWEEVGNGGAVLRSGDSPTKIGVVRLRVKP